MRRLDPKLRELVAEIAALRRRANALGVFTDERELLVCPGCGLMEDVATTGILLTYREPELGQDTGLRFEEISAGKFRCPTCGGSVTETPEKSAAKSKPAKRKARK